MSRELLQQALDALNFKSYRYESIIKTIAALEAELAKPEQAKYSDIVSDGGLDPRNKFDAQPEQEQEPVANEKEGSPCPEFWDWLPKAYNFAGNGVFTKYNMEVAFLAGKQFSSTAPPRKPWVGLTDDEHSEIYNDLYTQYTRDDVNIADFILIARAIEAQLKDKDNG